MIGLNVTSSCGRDSFSGGRTDRFSRGPTDLTSRGRFVVCVLPLLLGLLGCGSSELDRARESRPHILFLLIDTWREDHLGELPETAGAIPFSVRFANCQSQSPWTKPSVGSLMTGLHPSAHGALRGQVHARDSGVLQDPLGANQITLTERLNEEGYRTAAIQTNPNLTEEMGFDQGFDEFTYQYDAPAEWVTERALEWLSGVDETQSSFLYLHYMDPHLPYRAHPETTLPEYDGPVRDTMVLTDLVDMTLNAADRDYLQSLYRGEVRHVDREISRLLLELRKHPIWDELLIVLTSDHGEEFWEHGGFEHGHTVYDELLRLPLVFGGPWLQSRRESSEPSPDRGQSVNAQVRAIDVMPTLLEIVGAKNPEPMQGESFASALLDPQAELTGRDSYAEGLLYQEQRRSFRTDRWKLIQNLESRTFELYDIAADAGETTNLANDRTEVTLQLRERLVRLHNANRTLAKRIGPSEDRQIDKETLEQLRSLGYIQ